MARTDYTTAPALVWITWPVISRLSDQNVMLAQRLALLEQELRARGSRALQQ